MASNKYDTAFNKIEISDLTVSYKSEWGYTEFKGTPAQIITYILNLKNTGHDC